MPGFVQVIYQGDKLKLIDRQSVLIYHPKNRAGFLSKNAKIQEKKWGFCLIYTPYKFKTLVLQAFRI